MAEKNVRGAIRKKPDPMAIRTKGRVTTYEKSTFRIASPFRLRPSTTIKRLRRE